mmetsp:Transcript_32925/g.104825  ORF Transcript_32925/g.104825 Transcript_32925/m.104825 type:complete len:252 (-) Transcript_32925:174-929(-)
MKMEKLTIKARITMTWNTTRTRMMKAIMGLKAREKVSAKEGTSSFALPFSLPSSSTVDCGRRGARLVLLGAQAAPALCQCVRARVHAEVPSRALSRPAGSPTRELRPAGRSMCPPGKEEAAGPPQSCKLSPAIVDLQVRREGCQEVPTPTHRFEELPLLRELLLHDLSLPHGLRGSRIELFVPVRFTNSPCGHADGQPPRHDKGNGRAPMCSANGLLAQGGAHTCMRAAALASERSVKVSWPAMILLPDVT